MHGSLLPGGDRSFVEKLPFKRRKALVENEQPKKTKVTKESFKENPFDEEEHKNEIKW